MNDDLERIAEDIDLVEADLVRLQSRLWSVRQRLQKRIGKQVGFQYDDTTPYNSSRQPVKV